VRPLSSPDDPYTDLCRMSRVCESWSLEELVEMDEEDMEKLLEYYRSGAVPSFKKVRLGDQAEQFVFDGSFGWW